MSEEEFAQIVADEWEHIPERFKRRVENVAVLIEDEPSEEVRREEGLGEGETLLGLYHGVPNTARGSEYGVGITLPDTITIYRLSTLEAAEAIGGELATAVRAVVKETIWHELGHYFGYDDETIHRREDEGTNRYGAR